MAANVREIRLPEQLELTQPRNASQWGGTSFGGLKLSTLHRILQTAETGRVEELADLVEYMLADTAVRTVYETRLQAVAGAPWRVEPGAEDPDSVAAAELLSEELSLRSDIARTFGDLLHGVLLGWSALEHRWYRDGQLWRSAPVQIHPRDIRFASDWGVEVRTWINGKREQWLRADQHAGKFVVHLPRGVNTTAAKAGMCHAIVWAWLFKRYNEKFRNAAMERFGTPKVAAFVPTASTPTARQAIKDGLENLSYDHVAVFEAGVDLKIFEPTKDAGATVSATINALAEDITTTYLGSSLNTMVGSTGGNRALGESQFATTTLPRLDADAKRLANTVEHDYFAPWLEFNRHVFATAPSCPRLVFEVVPEGSPDYLVGNVTLAMQAGVLTKNELRRVAGFDPLPDGGDELAVVTVPSSTPFSTVTASASATDEQGVSTSLALPGGADAEVPFSRPTAAARGRTCSRSMTPLELALSGASVTSTRSSSQAQPQRSTRSRRGARKSSRP